MMIAAGVAVESLALVSTGGRIVLLFFQQARARIGCNLSRQGVPIEPAEFSLHIRQQLFIEFRGVLIRRTCLAKVHVVRMRVQQHHTAVLSNPVQLPLPKVDRLLSKHEKQSGILGQCVRQFDVSTPCILSAHPKRKYCIDAVWLGLEWIGVKSGRIVKYFKRQQPFQIVVHEPGTEPDGIPFFQILIDSLSASFETLFRQIKPSIVVQVMDADLESTGRQQIAQLLGRRIITFGNEIE